MQWHFTLHITSERIRHDMPNAVNQTAVLIIENFKESAEYTCTLNGRMTKKIYLQGVTGNEFTY